MLLAGRELGGRILGAVEFGLHPQTGRTQGKELTERARENQTILRARVRKGGTSTLRLRSSPSGLTVLTREMTRWPPFLAPLTGFVFVLAGAFSAFFAVYLRLRKSPRCENDFVRLNFSTPPGRTGFRVTLAIYASNGSGKWRRQSQKWAKIPAESAKQMKPLVPKRLSKSAERGTRGMRTFLEPSREVLGCLIGP